MEKWQRQGDEGRLNKIKDEKKRNAEETKLLWDAHGTAEYEHEEELEEERWKRAQAVVSTDDPLLNDIDYTSDFLDTQEGVL